MRILLILGLLLLSSCGQLPTVAERMGQADQLAAGKGWRSVTLNTEAFELTAFLPSSIERSKQLTIYIEGDGLAWLDRSTPSVNPTPVNPLALKLALQDLGPAAYLARPCQYQSRRNCQRRYWTSARFAPEVVAATSEAVEQLKRLYGAEVIVLVGYSGGGAVAALVAARRSDVKQLITIAGNLDHRFWSEDQRVTPLTGSLNPADDWHRLQAVPQIHFVGREDQIITERHVASYLNRFPRGLRPEVVVMPGYDHYCCWENDWSKLLSYSRLPD